MSPLTSISAPASTGVSARISASTRAFSPAFGDAHVDPDRRLGRHDVVGGADVGHRGRDGGAGGGVTEARRSPAPDGRPRSSALTPFSGSSPACAARPRTITSNVPVPLRPVFTAPPSALGSSTSTLPHASARCLEQRAGRLRADLLVGGEQHLHPRGVVECGHGVDRLHDAGLHVEHARARWRGRR